MFRRIAAFVAVLALGAGNIAVCAGWQPTPDARMACCMDDAGCPTHTADRHDHSSKRAASQSRADSCCATAAQRRDSAAAVSRFADSSFVALVPLDTFTASPRVFMSQQWRALVPLPASSTPKHLLLSVFLV
jgi:hypothetical protein